MIATQLAPGKQTDVTPDYTEDTMTNTAWRLRSFFAAASSSVKRAKTARHLYTRVPKWLHNMRKDGTHFYVIIADACFVGIISFGIINLKLV